MRDKLTPETVTAWLFVLLVVSGVLRFAAHDLLDIYKAWAETAHPATAATPLPKPETTPTPPPVQKVTDAKPRQGSR
jgi:hypothetical protein